MNRITYQTLPAPMSKTKQNKHWLPRLKKQTYFVPILSDHVLRAVRGDWCSMGGSVVERRSLIGELSLVCTGPAADG